MAEASRAEKSAGECRSGPEVSVLAQGAGGDYFVASGIAPEMIFEALWEASCNVLVDRWAYLELVVMD
jgi:hypothetical protein